MESLCATQIVSQKNNVHNINNMYLNIIFFFFATYNFGCWTNYIKKQYGNTENSANDL